MFIFLYLYDTECELNKRFFLLFVMTVNDFRCEQFPPMAAWQQFFKNYSQARSESER